MNETIPEAILHFINFIVAVCFCFSGNLVDLEYLNASETSVKSLPPEIAFCERLQEINLYGNILEMLPETMRELNELTELKINARSFHSNIDEYMNKLLRYYFTITNSTETLSWRLVAVGRSDLVTDRSSLNTSPACCLTYRSYELLIWTAQG